MAPIPLPNFPSKITTTMLRVMIPGQSRIFAHEGKIELRATSIASRINSSLQEGATPYKFQHKTAIVVDPVSCQSVKVLFITRVA